MTVETTKSTDFVTQLVTEKELAAIERVLAAAREQARCFSSKELRDAIEELDRARNDG